MDFGLNILEFTTIMEEDITVKKINAEMEITSFFGKLNFLQRNKAMVNITPHPIASQVPTACFEINIDCAEYEDHVKKCYFVCQGKECAYCHFSVADDQSVYLKG